MMKFLIFLIFGIGSMNYKKFYMMIFLLMFLFMLKVNLILNLWVMIYKELSIDFYSFYLVILSFYICGLMLMIKLSDKMKFIIMILLMILILNFMTFNLMIFYFLFEASLLPIFLLIKLDGYTFERFESMIYMFFFTMVLSIPFLVILMILMNNFNTMFYFIMMFLDINLSLFKFMVLMMIFLVKMPMFFIHIWLPKAHVEAPVYGSMILAGVLLKLGSYGILRMSQVFFIPMNKYNVYLISISLIGSILMSLVCLVQVDMKMLVAYSSVVHMGLLIGSLSTLSKLGFIGAYLMMIGHGLCSSGLFYLVNISYKRINSRLLFLNKGVINYNSILSMWWFLMCIGNFSAPITINLIGEILMLMSLVSFDKILMIHMGLMCFLSASYSLYLFSYTQHGGFNVMLKVFYEVSLKEYLILFLHWFPLNFLTFGLNFFMV